MGKFEQQRKQRTGGTLSKNTSVCLGRSGRLHCSREGVVCAFGAWGGCVEHAAGGGNRIAPSKGRITSRREPEPPGRYWCYCTKMLLSMTMTKIKTMANRQIQIQIPRQIQLRKGGSLQGETADKQKCSLPNQRLFWIFTHNTVASQFPRSNSQIFNGIDCRTVMKPFANHPCHRHYRKQLW